MQHVYSAFETLKLLKDHPRFIGVDSNAHSALWGNQRTDERGEFIEELLNEYNGSLLNDGKYETFHCSRGKSFVDLSITNDKGLQITSNWYVDTEKDSMSDHRFIFWNAHISIETIKILKRVDVK